MKFHRKYRGYWNLSTASKWLREKAGLDNPKALSWEDWKIHHKKSQEKSPFVDWLTRDGLRSLQNIIFFPADCVYSVKLHFKNSKGNTHVLDGGLDKGTWYDLCWRMPHCMFYELDKFITQEKGLKTHEWEKTLVMDESWGVKKDDPDYGKPTNQALAAIEQELIWTWWKENKHRDEDFTTLEDEVAYLKEQEEMLIRLIKIRGSLWS